MNSTTDDILLLTFASFGILFGMTMIGEIWRARQPLNFNNPLLDTYQTRVQSWWGMVALIGFSLLLGKPGVMVLFAFTSFAALREFLTLTVKNQADHIALALAFFLVLPLQYIFIGFEWQTLFTVFIPIYAFLFLPIVSALRGNADRFLIRVAETQWGLMIAVFCVSHVPALLTLDIPGNEGRSVLLVAFLVMVVQLGDLMEYFCGKRFGKTKIAPEISPKTVEGVICGVGSAMLVGALLAWITPFGIVGAMLMAGVASLVGMGGNIVFAAIKRDRGVRDWSHLIPGQGGFVDQLDSVIFAAPIFYRLVVFIWVP